MHIWIYTNARWRDRNIQAYYECHDVNSLRQFIPIWESGWFIMQDHHARRQILRKVRGKLDTTSYRLQMSFLTRVIEDLRSNAIDSCRVSFLDERRTIIVCNTSDYIRAYSIGFSRRVNRSLNSADVVYIDLVSLLRLPCTRLYVRRFNEDVVSRLMEVRHFRQKYLS